MKGSPASATMRQISTPSATDTASGFSHRIGLRAAIAAPISALWSLVTEQIATASQASSSRSISSNAVTS